MKGKTKGERKNKSIKKNQIPAFILTGGEWDEQNPAGKMNEAVVHVQNLIENCKGQNEILINQRKDLIRKLQILKSQIDDLKLDDYERLKNEKSDIDGEMEKLKQEKDSLVSQIEKLTTENQQIGELQKKITDAEEAKRAEDLKKKQAASLISQGMVPQITSQSTETVSKIQMLTDKLSDNETEITSLNNEINSKGADITDLTEKKKLIENDLTAKTKELGQKTTEMEAYLKLLKDTYENLMALTGTDSGEETQSFVDTDGTPINIAAVGEMFNTMTNKLSEATDVSQASIAEKEQEIASNKENIARLEADKIAAEKRATEAEARANTAKKNAGIAQQSAKDAVEGSNAATELLRQQCEKTLQTELTKAQVEKDKALAEAKIEAETADQKCKEQLAAAQAKNDEALAEAKREAETAQQAAETADQKCKEQLAAAQTELAAEKKEKEDCQEELDKKKSKLLQNDDTIGSLQQKLKELANVEDKLEKEKSEKKQLQDTINTKLIPCEQSNEMLRVENVNLKEKLEKSISKEDCDELVEQAENLANAGRVAGEAAAAVGPAPVISINEVGKTPEEDIKTLLKASVTKVNDPSNDNMDYLVEHSLNKGNNNEVRKNFELNSHGIKNDMVFLYVHEKYRDAKKKELQDSGQFQYISMYKESKDEETKNYNRQMYICKITNISNNNNITADCWNITSSINPFIKPGFDHNLKNNNNILHQHFVELKRDSSRPIQFLLDTKNKNKVYKELLTPIINATGKKEENEKFNYAEHSNTNIPKIKNQNIIPVYPPSNKINHNLLIKSTDKGTINSSINYIIYLTDYEKIIDKNKYFPIKDNGNNNFTMYFKNSVEIRYLHSLMYNHDNPLNILKTKEHEKYLNLKTHKVYTQQKQQQQQQQQQPQQKQTLEEQGKETTRRLLDQVKKSINDQRGGKKNLTKEYMKGGYRYSALGMKGLTIDLSGLKGKKTRRVKKKGKTVKNKKGSRKVKKGSRKDKTKKNKRRGRTYRNKNNFF